MMETIFLTSLPQIDFAHIFNTDKKYSNFLYKRADSFEIGYLSAGEIHWIIENQEYYIKADCIFFLPHDKEIKICSAGGNEHHSVGFHGSFALRNYKLPFIMVPSSSPYFISIKENIDRLVQLFQLEPHKQQKIFYLLSQILDNLNEHIENEEQHPETSTMENIHTKRIKNYIINNLNKAISLQELSDALHISVQYLCALFKKSTGETIISYINKQKVLRMKTLIIHHNFSLKEACAQVGIADQSYASRLFKKYEETSLRTLLLSLRSKA